MSGRWIIETGKLDHVMGNSVNSQLIETVVTNDIDEIINFKS